MADKFACLARTGASPEVLAEAFIADYFKGKAPSIPVNPFQILRDLGIAFSFRNFSSYEGVYIPPEDCGDMPVVGINANRPITRQRFTASHELCHHIKDAGSGYMCAIGSDSDIERYAEAFAAALLMPMPLFRAQVEKHQVDGFVSFDDALRIADYFGVSFAACVNRLAFDLHVIEGDISGASLRQRRSDFGPTARRAELGMNDVLLYRQLYDVAEPFLRVLPAPQTQQIFETEYVFHDSRMEGVAVDRELAAEIVVDLRLRGGGSKFCGEENRNIVEVAGLVSAYDWVFKSAATDRQLTVYDAKTINEKLFSAAKHPEFGGSYRQANTLVLGGKFETVDYRSVAQEMYLKGKEIDELMRNSDVMVASEYVERVLDIHHDLTVVHPFRDGNGRSLRAFANLMFLKRGLPPVLFADESKDLYKDALGKADKAGDRSALYEVYYKEMLKSHAIFTDSLL